MSRPKLNDPVLVFMLEQLRIENEKLPPDSKRMGFRAYCKKYGILLPEDFAAIEAHETPWRDDGFDEGDI